MNTIDVKGLIDQLKLKETLSKSFAKKTGIDQKVFENHFETIVNNELESIGKSIAEGQFDESQLSRLRGLSLQEFMQENDKIIKDK